MDVLRQKMDKHFHFIPEMMATALIRTVSMREFCDKEKQILTYQTFRVSYRRIVNSNKERNNSRH